MNRIKLKGQLLLLSLLFIIPMVVIADSISAVKSLLTDAKGYYETGQYEQSAALLERALRIKSRNPYLWYNLAGVRLAQEDWKRAANLAQRSNALAGSEQEYKKLRVRNWVIVTLACEGLGDMDCARGARDRAQILVQSLY